MKGVRFSAVKRWLMVQGVILQKSAKRLKNRTFQSEMNTL